MGTMLQARGLPLGGLPEEMNMTAPQMVQEIHALYLAAGADVVYTNTFGANAYKLSRSRYAVTEVIEAAVAIAKAACGQAQGERRPLVALDIGPLGRMMRPAGDLSFDEAYGYFKEQVLAGRDADLIVIETMSDLLEVKAALLAAKENASLPVVCTMTFERSLRTFTGVNVPAMAMTLEGLGADAIGVNCSMGPLELIPAIEEMRQYTNLPLVVKANAGLPDPATSAYTLTPTDFAAAMARMADLGVQIFGGCCGTDERFIQALHAMLLKYDFTKVPPRPQVTHTAVCSATRAVVIDQPRIIGERINPTGKKRFKQALQERDIDYILDQALEQVDAGADILDVNVGLPGIDETEMMVTCVQELQAVVDTPLQIDSASPAVVEAALRAYNGKPIVNSVNGEETSMASVLPLVKKYGACLLCLTLDENGIPQTVEERIAIAKRIVERALRLGIPRENLIIDCLTLTVSAEQDGAAQTLQAVARVKRELGLKTVLGVSNVSFGLPNRELVNSTFLTMALQMGLDLPILNPNIPAMTGAFRAFKVLAGYDRSAEDFIRHYADTVVKTSVSGPAQPAAQAEAAIAGADLPGKLRHAIEAGLKAESGAYTQALLKAGTSAMDIIEGTLIPALDAVGSLFEVGKVFLPQLILAAAAAQASFAVLRAQLAQSESAPISRGKIVLATVKGDIHDIGKNIVKVLLENYGYTVIDLGKDVEPQSVVEAAKAHGAKLVGLSALMTTTLPSMESTISLLRQANLPCKVMVGGAVLTPDYAQTIGADYYAKDAKAAVDVAKRIYGG
jgi:5-methyltetrahydrofolate--homocysteine methyltransferase